jgi:hypothetical protein
MKMNHIKEMTQDFLAWMPEITREDIGAIGATLLVVGIVFCTAMYCINKRK